MYRTDTITIMCDQTMKARVYTESQSQTYILSDALGSIQPKMTVPLVMLPALHLEGDLAGVQQQVSQTDFINSASCGH